MDRFNPMPDKSALFKLFYYYGADNCTFNTRPCMKFEHDPIQATIDSILRYMKGTGHDKRSLSDTLQDLYEERKEEISKDKYWGLLFKKIMYGA